MASGKLHSVRARILGGRADANIAFTDLIGLLTALGFDRRQRGDHHILWKTGIVEIINLQPRAAKAKPYQVKQVRRILRKYELRFADEHAL